MNNKQQTSVEWLLNAIETKNGEEFSSYYSEFIEQAKEMNRKEIAKAFDDGECNYFYSRKTGNDFTDGEEYFNELYGTEEL